MPKYGKKDLSDERFGAKLRVTENRCVVFDFLTYVCFALYEQKDESKNARHLYIMTGAGGSKK